jgi:hypothetical protein
VNDQELPDGPIGMEAVEDPQPVPSKCEAPVPTPEEDFERIMGQRFGNAWRETLVITVPVSTISWVINLAWQGLKARQVEWQAKPGGLTMMDKINLGSLRGDIEKLVEASRIAPVYKEPKTKKKSKR